MAIVGWIDTDTVEDEVMRLATTYNSDLGTIDSGIITRATQSAYNRIVSVLVGRGYTLTQINAWIERKDYQLDMALCWSLKKLGFQRGDEQNFVDDFCREDELDEANIVNESGEEIEPDTPSETAFSVMDFEEINDDLGIELPG